ncbi:MAG: dihydrolipoyl dehydrogenase family protein [Planctomycetota bacterium]|jgi:dihydrolipoamide dehydrogenase
MVVGQFALETNLVVIGGGAGGYAAALRAAKLGVETMLVDASAGAGGAAPGAGGASWTGLRRLREIVRLRAHASELGVKISRSEIDLTALQDRMQQSVEVAAERRQEQCRAAGVQLLEGSARFDDARQITVHGGPNARVRFKRAIIATGARAVPPEGGWPDSQRVTDWFGAWQCDRLPESLLVVGGGSIATEMAGAFATLGSDVWLAAPSRRVLATADHDLTRPVEQRLREMLKEIHVRTTVTALKDVDKGVEARLEGKGGSETRTFEHVLVALGNRPQTADLRLDKAKVDGDADGSIVVNDQLRTSNPRILAIGDVTGEPMLANKAAHQARIAADVVAGRDSVFEPRTVPRVVHTEPPVAWCGLTEAKAKATATAHRVCTVTGPSQELIKLLFDPVSKLLLGAGIAGPGAAEMIGEAALAIEMAAVAEDLAATVHPHPSLSQLIAEAAQAF